MTPVERLLAKLPGATKSGKGWSARCPAHDDRRASLSISEGDNGTALLTCHAGCEASAVVSAVGLKLADLFPESPDRTASRPPKPKAVGCTYPTARMALDSLEARHGTRSGLWSYRDAGKNLVGFVVRWDRAGGKDIRPVSGHADGWRVGALPEPRPLYRLPELATANRVIVVEGEKCADAAQKLGFSATTSAGGSGAATKTDWRPLADKDVWILPDNDTPGRKYAHTVAGILTKLTPPAVVKIVELPGLPDKGDIVDWIGSRGDTAKPDDLRQEIQKFASNLPPEKDVPTTNEVERSRPFPVEVLPEPIRSFVAAGAKAIGCDLSYLALPLLTSIAAAIGNTRRLELKRGWSAPAILWGAIVGESGTAKTPAFKLVMRPIRERQRKALERHAVEMKRYEVELARWEKEFTVWKRSKNASDDPPEKPPGPHSERYVVSDTTVEALAPILMANPRGLLLARDELAGWIGSFDRYAGKVGADAANWLSMFNAESVIVDRKTGLPRTIHVPQAAVCVTGGIQPGILQRVLGEEHRESGLAARLLLACPPRKAKRWTDADIDPKAEAELMRLFDRLCDLRSIEIEDGETKPVLVRLDAKAKAAWMAYYNTHADEQVDLTGDLSAAWSKLEEYAARLALVIHLVRWAANDPVLTNVDILDADCMNAGIALTTWFKGEARRVYAMLSESEVGRDQRRLIEWIERKGGSVTQREVQQGCRWLKESGAAEAALDGLVKIGQGHWRDAPTTDQGGRPSRVFELPEPSTVYETPATHVEEGGSVDVDSVDGAEEHSGDPRVDPNDDSNHPQADGRLYRDYRDQMLPD